jgi:hypothetical protein
MSQLPVSNTPSSVIKTRANLRSGSRSPYIEHLPLASAVGSFLGALLGALVKTGL